MSRIHGVTWLLIREGRVLLERCPKKAQVLGVGEWFVPGGKIEADEIAEQALIRELYEEWPGVTLLGCEPLPIVEGSRVPTGNGLFLMRPFVISVAGEIPNVSADGIELRWAPLHEALTSPVPQVRMMVAGAVAGLGADTERLDWIEERFHGTGETLWVGGSCYWALEVQRSQYAKEKRIGEGGDLREAIDDAREKAP